MPLVGESLDGVFVFNDKIFAYRHDYNSQVDTTTVRVIDLTTNQILHTIDGLQDLGKYPVFVTDPAATDQVQIRFTKVFFDTEQQKEYLMNLNLKTRIIEWMIQL
jgi:predicted RNA-binding protein with TRAM domain